MIAPGLQVHAVRTARLRFPACSDRSPGSRRTMHVGERASPRWASLAFDAATDGEDCQAQEDGFGQPGSHFDVGAGGRQVLARGAE